MVPADEPQAHSSELPSESAKPPSPSLTGMGIPTLGGMQFWGDVQYFRGWKIQRNVFSGHYRLLSPAALRYASGSLCECQQALNEVRHTRQLTPDTGKAVILIHGIGRSAKSFAAMGAALQAEGYVVVPFEYPSTRVSMEQAAEYLDSTLKSLTDVQSIDFVVHSMGGLIVRTYLKNFAAETRLHRMVMLGTPNQGAQLADMLQSNLLFRMVYGPAGKQLVTDEQGPVRSLPVPCFPFAIIAGGKGNDSGFNPLLPGDDDGTVTIESARLSGASDFLRVPKLHSFLMSDPAAITATLHFLREGRFHPTAPPTPIP